MTRSITVVVHRQEDLKRIQVNLTDAIQRIICAGQNGQDGERTCVESI